MKRINCVRCAYYFVTWEPNQPHGCKAYGFKSKVMPSLAVKQSSGLPCQFFTPKHPK
ncbi:MAG: uracil-DNA glycosylase [Campylobacterota bacterium]|nr:uracil-DNA glycosylase [Campylobacterota bacterium]